MTVSSTLALHGGSPVRTEMLPYGRQSIREEDIQAVTEVLSSAWLTTGPKVSEFEKSLSNFVGASYGVAVNSGTAALQSAAYALELKAGDEVLVPTITFLASASVFAHLGVKPVFIDVEEDTLLIDVHCLEAKITPRTRCIVTVDYAGQPCEYHSIKEISEAHNMAIIDDACHSLGASYKGQPIGSIADMTAFSFHPVKHITTGEGGMVTSNQPGFLSVLRRYRNHGMNKDHRQRTEEQSWKYTVEELGFNFRLSDIQCALGISQLNRLSKMIDRRREIALEYDKVLSEIPEVNPLCVRNGRKHVYHLYVVRLDTQALSVNRDEIFNALRAEGIGVNVHYYPLHLQKAFQRITGCRKGDCPVAERMIDEIIALPIYPDMTCSEQSDVIEALGKVINYYRR